MKRLLLFIGLSLCISQVYAWTRTADFEGGTTGSYAVGPNALDARAGQATFSNQFVHSGNMALRAEVQAGNTPYGGKINFPQPLREGDEVWFRAYWYYPAGLDFTTTGQGLKTMRIKTQDSANKGTGHHSIYRSNVSGRILPHSEVMGSVFWDYVFASAPYGGGAYGQKKITTGNWYALEMYVKFSSKPGQGIYRIWEDGNLIFEDKNTATFRNSTDVSKYALIGNYWNGSGPQTQAPYVDDVVITNQKPSKIDAHGNPMIGLGLGGLALAPPNPPVPF